MGSSFSRMEQNLGKAGYIFSKSFRVQLWACRREECPGGLPITGERVSVPGHPPYTTVGSPCRSGGTSIPLSTCPAWVANRGTPSPRGTHLPLGPARCGGPSLTPTQLQIPPPMMEKGKGPPSADPLLPEQRGRQYLCPVWSPTVLLHDALVGQPVVEAGDVLPVGPGGGSGREGISGGCGGICTPRKPSQETLTWGGQPQGPITGSLTSTG